MADKCGWLFALSICLMIAASAIEEHYKVEVVYETYTPPANNQEFIRRQGKVLHD